MEIHSQGSCSLLLIHWRNRIIHHHSTANLTKKQVEILISNKELMQKEHANIDIEKTIENFNNKRITLKDISTIISITIKYVRQVDTFLQLESNLNINIEYWIKYSNLTNEYNKLFHSNKPDKSKVFKQFFKTYFPFISDETIKDIISHNKPLEDE